MAAASGKFPSRSLSAAESSTLRAAAQESSLVVGEPAETQQWVPEAALVDVDVGGGRGRWWLGSDGVVVPLSWTPLPASLLPVGPMLLFLHQVGLSLISVIC